jgi:hypothetical protein
MFYYFRYFKLYLGPVWRIFAGITKDSVPEERKHRNASGTQERWLSFHTRSQRNESCARSPSLGFSYLPPWLSHRGENGTNHQSVTAPVAGRWLPR